MARKYDASSINVLDELEGVRFNPSMYLGDVDYMGSLQSFKEMVQNSTDELREVGGGKVKVIIREAKGSQIITVADEGRGIPVEKHPKTGLSTLETVFTKLHAGGKSGGKSAYGKRTIGVHGVGASVVNALSTSLTVWSKRKGLWWSMSFSRGKVIKKLAKSAPPFAWKCGTIVEYQLDTSIMTDPLRLADAQQYCALARYWDPVTIEYKDPDRKATLEASTPDKLLAKTLKNRDCEVIAGPVVISHNGTRAIVCWANTSKEDVVASVAGAPVSSGTHVQGLEDAAQLAFATVFKSKKIDATIGLLAVLDVSVDRPSFSGQNKTALKTRETRQRVRDGVTPELIKYLRKHRAEAEMVIDNAKTIGKINAEMDERKDLAKKGKRKSALPKKFVSALRFPAERRELFVIEGDSAKGTAMQAKMPWQELFAIRGKLPNVIKKSSLVDNEIIRDFITVTGYDALRPDKPLRVSKIVLLTDADDDGDHISVLLLTMIVKLMPKVLASGKVYIVRAPLFEAINKKGDQVSGNDLRQMEKQHGMLKNVNRMKGWGGCEPPLLNEVAFDPRTRNWAKIGSPSDEDKKQFELLMGKDTSARKQMMEQP
jgi:DNA gyrase/topoisomerase IV subunit B